eukprot:TRINITY_DN6174_c0_g1_i2.p1 TRINITY_DN6174_c0_g1~~TRINITY_DN6174_c0_g1_i2.p1  ORF type:complete len:195 (+),score=33.47 TRINITY_DN6174_c0_g1_i2:717-1301(+)
MESALKKNPFAPSGLTEYKQSFITDESTQWCAVTRYTAPGGDLPDAWIANAEQICGVISSPGVPVTRDSMPREIQNALRGRGRNAFKVIDQKLVGRRPEHYASHRMVIYRGDGGSGCAQYVLYNHAPEDFDEHNGAPTVILMYGGESHVLYPGDSKVVSGVKSVRLLFGTVQSQPGEYAEYTMDLNPKYLPVPE